MTLGSFFLVIYSDQSEFHQAAHGIIVKSALTDERWIEIEELKQIVEKNDSIGISGHNFPQMQTMESLQKVCFALCEDLQREKVYMLSQASLNSLIEHHENIDQIIGQLPSVATSIQNVELLNKKKNIFARFLGD